MIRYIVAWLAMVFLAVANGALRQLSFGNHMSELHAHQLSTAIDSVLFAVFIWLVVHNWPPSSAGQAVAVGAIWLLLTVVFEFAMSRLFMHRPWSRLFRDYNLLEGRVWILFLAWLTMAPYLFYRLRKAV
jgi:hypothetical protein